MNETNKLTDLIDIPILQKMQNTFAKMARMAALITDENGIAITEPSNFTDFCTNYCRKSPIGKKRCEDCDKMGAMMTLVQNEPVSYKCHAKLVDFAAPIMLGEEVIGSFVGGQVLSEPLDEDEIRKVAKEIEVDEEGMVEASKKIQVIPEAAITRSTDFLFEFAKILSDMAYKTYCNKQLSDEAMAAATQKSDFLANMSHEIRTPMNAVLGMAEMALREDMSDEAKNYIHQIQTSGKHLLVIINDILDFSKIDSGKMEIIEALYETEDMIEELVNLVNSRIGDKENEFMVDVPADMATEMYGDNIRIQQVLINLLNNAVKFTTRGKITLKIRFDWIDDSMVMFKASVIDTGNGIKQSDLDKLFASFQQVDSKRNRSVEGTGLGLVICKRLAELMNGNISVTSEYGVGSTFSVSFPQKVQVKAEPIKKLDKPVDVYCMIQNEFLMEQLYLDLSKVNTQVIDITEAGQVTYTDDCYVIIEKFFGADSIISEAKKNPNVNYIVIEKYNETNDIKEPNVQVLRKPVYSKNLYAALGLCKSHKHGDGNGLEMFTFIAPDANILIVDDNPINLSVAKGLLEPLKMQVDTATCAMECVDLTKKKAYDLVFMDHMMPGVDGVETTHILRRMVSGYESIPIIALTANAVGGAKEMFISEGMNDMVAKPIETKKIIAKVREWIPKEKIVPVDESEIEIDQNSTSELLDGARIEDLALRTGLDIKAGLVMLGSEKLYMQFLKEYYFDVDKKITSISKAMETEDYKTYTIDVHALKSASRQIGATDLGELAAKLEKAGNDLNIPFIKFRTPHLLEDYASLRDVLTATFPEWLVELTQKNSSDVSIAVCLEEMSEALSAFDTLTIDEVFEKIKQAKIESEEEQMIFYDLEQACESYDIDRCVELVEKWRELID